MSTPRESARKRWPSNPSIENFKKQAKQLAKAKPALSLQQAQHQLAKSYGLANWDELLVKAAANHSAFFAAVDAGDKGALARFLAADPRLVHARRQRRADSPPGVRWGATALHLAARLGNLELVKLLVERGADVEAGASGTDALSQATPLHWAAESNQFEVVRFLVERGADVNTDAQNAQASPGGESRWAHPRIAQYLLAHGAKATIFAAVTLQKGETVRQMIASDPTLLKAHSSPQDVGLTPLHLAARRNLPDMIDLLLELGAPGPGPAPGSLRDKLGRTAADVALAGGHREAYERLVAHGLKPSPKWVALAGDIDRAARMARFLWACGGDIPIVRACLKEDAGLATAKMPDLWPDNYCGATALHFAAWAGQQKIARLLLDHGADLSAKDERYGGNPINWAMENHQKEMVKFLSALRR